MPSSSTWSPTANPEQQNVDKKNPPRVAGYLFPLWLNASAQTQEAYQADQAQDAPEGKYRDRRDCRSGRCCVRSNSYVSNSYGHVPGFHVQQEVIECGGFSWHINGVTRSGSTDRDCGRSNDHAIVRERIVLKLEGYAAAAPAVDPSKVIVAPLGIMKG